MAKKKIISSGSKGAPASEIRYQRVLITPDVARKMLEKNINNRGMSNPTITAYAKDMLNDDWNENTGVPIVFNKAGYLEDGQHRLMAVIHANKPIWFNVCYGADENGVYDENRRRTVSNFAERYFDDNTNPKMWHNKTFSVVNGCLKLMHSEDVYTTFRSTNHEIVNFEIRERENLEKFFEVVPYSNAKKVCVQGVHVGLFLALVNDVNPIMIHDFYQVLCTGVPVPEYQLEGQTSIIRLREFLINNELGGGGQALYPVTRRTQHALYLFLNNKGVRTLKEPKTLRWNTDILKEHKRVSDAK